MCPQSVVLDFVDVLRESDHVFTLCDIGEYFIIQWRTCSVDAVISVGDESRYCCVAY